LSFKITVMAIKYHSILISNSSPRQSPRHVNMLTHYAVRAVHIVGIFDSVAQSIIYSVVVGIFVELNVILTKL